MPGPRLIVVTRAIVATGSYGPSRSSLRVRSARRARRRPTARTRSPGWCGARSAAEPTGSRSTPTIGWGPGGELRPTFTQHELEVLVAAARGAGRPVAAHAMTPEGMRRAVLAGVETVEHGDQGTPEVFRLMRQRGVALCPTLAAGEAYATYFDGWVKGRDEPTPDLVGQARELPGGARGGRHDLLRRRRRRLPRTATTYASSRSWWSTA